MKRLKIGVLGAGLIGKRHIDTILACPDEAELVGIADPVTGAEKYPRVKAPFFKTAEALLDAAKPDSVVIATPNNLHAPQGIECARQRSCGGCAVPRPRHHGDLLCRLERAAGPRTRCSAIAAVAGHRGAARERHRDARSWRYRYASRAGRRTLQARSGRRGLHALGHLALARKTKPRGAARGSAVSLEEYQTETSTVAPRSSPSWACCRARPLLRMSDEPSLSFSRASLELDDWRGPEACLRSAEFFAASGEAGIWASRGSAIGRSPRLSRFATDGTTIERPKAL
ncbi:MAG: hypothetical protein FJX55_13250 [Alphaproteobacteria bacterium]|nr:hypothetical protein [Alphaproteobacteria bacterium]